jgi:2-amino-4-hydroxy-6-hydroxymethyldihydropteridine diphosphokinase
LTEQKKILISIGSNTGNRKHNIDESIRLLCNSQYISDLKISHYYQSEPYGFKEQPHFLNNVISFRSDLPPQELLVLCKNIEKDIGRIYRGKWQSREIDLDIILYDSFIYDDKILKIPHPEMHLRRFVLVPACEIEPNRVHPVLNKTIMQLLFDCKDKSKVDLFVDN